MTCKLFPKFLSLLSIFFFSSGIFAQNELSVLALIKEGSYYESIGRLATAERKFRQALIIDVSNKDACIKLFEVLLDRGKWIDALKICTVYRKESPYLSRCFNALKRIEKDLWEIQDFLEYLRPENYSTKKAYNPSLVFPIKKFLRKLKVRELESRIHLWLALAYYEAGEYQNALDQVEKIEHFLDNRSIIKEADDIRYNFRVSSLANYQSKQRFRLPLTNIQIGYFSVGNGILGGYTGALIIQEIATEQGVGSKLSSIGMYGFEAQARIFSIGTKFGVNFYGMKCWGDFYDKNTDLYEANPILDPIFDDLDLGNGNLPYADMTGQEYGPSIEFGGNSDRVLMQFILGHNWGEYNFTGLNLDTLDTYWNLKANVIRAEIRYNAIGIGTAEVPNFGLYFAIGGRFMYNSKLVSVGPEEGVDIELFDENTETTITAGDGFNFSLRVGLSLWL